MNFIFISPTFPRVYYQFPRATKKHGIKTLAIAEDSYDSLPNELKESLDEYYKVDSLENYEEVYKAVAYFSFKYGKIDWIESNNEHWLSQDARLRTDFNIKSGAKSKHLNSFKLKSEMKRYYKKANIKVAKHHMVSTLEKGKKFIKDVGYPVVVKPDNGVGAFGTYSINNEEELLDFYKKDLQTEYIMEQYLEGIIESYDGIVNSKGEIVFETAHIFPIPIMEIVNEKGDCIYYSEREIPKDLQTLGKKAIAAFKPKSRFFHFEFFRLTKDIKGLAKKGELVGLEVNMRPPGGFTTDMMNFANDIDVYDIYAQMILNDKAEYSKNRPYHCVYIGRRDNYDYKYSTEDIYNKYKEKMQMNERVAKVLSGAMGDTLYNARFKTIEEVREFINYTTEKR